MRFKSGDIVAIDYSVDDQWPEDMHGFMVLIEGISKNGLLYDYRFMDERWIKRYEEFCSSDIESGFKLVKRQPKLTKLI